MRQGSLRKNRLTIPKTVISTREDQQREQIPDEEKNFKNQKNNKIEKKFKHNFSLKKMRTGTSMLGYFDDDEKDESKRVEMEGRYLYYTYSINFSIRQYFRFLILHIFYFGLFGPLMLLSMIFKPKMRFLFKNMLFTNVKCVTFYAQNYYYLSTACVYYALWKNLEVFDLNLLKTLIISFILRSSTIAGKYATFPKQQILKYEEIYIKKKELDSELMMLDWLRQRDDIVDSELKNSISRNEVDTSVFKIAFISKISPSTQKRIFKSNFNDDDMLDEYDLIQGNNGLLYYDAQHIMKFLIRESNQINKNSGFGWYFFLAVLSLIYGSIPKFFRIYRGETILGSTQTEKFISVVTGISNAFLLFTTIMFFNQSVVDLKRKNFLLQQLGQMISPRKKFDLSTRKILPTINLSDSVSLNSWVSLRKIALDYGLKYFYRHQIFLPVIFILCFFSLVAIFFIEISWGKEKHQEFFNKHSLEELQIFLLIDFIIFFLMLFIMLFSTAKINSHYGSMLTILNENEQIFLGIHRYKDFYFREMLIEDREVIDEYTPVFNEPSRSYIHKRLVEEIFQIVGDRGFKEMENILMEVASFNQEVIKMIEWEEKHGSLKILGFPITNSGVFNFLFAFFGVLLSVYEILYV